jgi:hypothetical protein
MDYKKLEIGQDAKNAHTIADDALGELERADADLNTAKQAIEDAKHFDNKRVHRIEANRLMIETVEAALLTGATADKSAEVLLRVAAARIRDAIDYQTGDFFTITVFKREERDGDTRMYPIAREWTDQATSAGGRSWAKGAGYTGVLWSLASDNPRASVVEPDTLLAGIAEKYPVSPRDAAREGRYRSVASFPITIGSANDVWGAVTATSDRPRVFDHKGDLARQSVETIRDVAVAAGLLAKLDDGRS